MSSLPKSKDIILACHITIKTKANTDQKIPLYEIPRTLPATDSAESLVVGAGKKFGIVMVCSIVLAVTIKPVADNEAA